MAAKKEELKEIVITSVRNGRKSIKIAWTEGADSVSREFHDNPRKSFYKAIEGLVPHVCTLCELPEKDAKKITATGITVTAKGDNNLALIVAQKKIKKAGRVFNISTPLLPMYPDAENKSADHMEDAESRAIEKVVAEAKKYLLGDREQGQIAFEDEKAPEEPKGEGTAPLPFAAEGAGG